MRLDGLDDFSCLFCNELIEEIFIRCEVCHESQQQQQEQDETSPFIVSRQIRAPNICLECFSNGLETDEHKNDHAYRVINLRQIPTLNSRTLFDDLTINSRSSKHQLGFLNKLPRIIDNESDLDAETCLRQFESWFGLFGHNSNESRTKKPRLRSTIVLYKEPGPNQSESSNGINSIRPQVHSKLYRAMSGYRAARGDFETESRENFEYKHLANMDYEQKDEVNFLNYPDEDESVLSDEQVMLQLKLSVLSSYNDVIQDRYEKKKLIRDFGMITELGSTAKTSRTSAMQYQVWNRQGERFSHSTDSVTHLQKFNTDSVHHWNLPSKFMRFFNNYESYAKTTELLNHFGYDFKQKLIFQRN